MNSGIKRISIITFLFVVVTVEASPQSIDSLRKALTSSVPDTNRVSILSTLAITYLQENVDSSMKFAHEGLELARKLNFKKGEADCLRRSGIVHFIQGRYPEALDIFQKALALSEDIHYSFGIAAGLGHIGNIYFEQDDYGSAKTYYARYLKIARAMHNKMEEANALMRIGETYLQQNYLDSASTVFDGAYTLVISVQDKRLLGSILKNLGKLEIKKQNDEQAMIFFRQGIGYATEASIYNILSDIYLEMAELFKRKGQPDSCIYYGRQALVDGQKNNYAKNMLAASKLLAETYETINEGEALKFYQMASTLRDSLFNTEKTTQVRNLLFLEQQRQNTIAASRTKYNNRLKLYSLLVALFIFLLLAIILYRNNRAKQKANAILNQQKVEIQKQHSKAENALKELKSTQAQLIQSEKMASLGELTAGIAHEIQNPLNFVNNFSEVNNELIEELKIKSEKLKIEDSEVGELLSDIYQNNEKISMHGKRADAIVKGMLQHSRTSGGKKELTDLNALTDEYLRLAYHGLRAKDKSFNATLKTDFDEGIGNINIVPQDIGRAILNLITNAFYAVSERAKLQAAGYEPQVIIQTKRISGKTDRVEIKVKDNGNGIPKNIVEKIFQPFFTTKPTGQGTGLGLSLAYDIVKAHGGELKVVTKEGGGSEFIIQLPTKSNIP